MTRRCGRDPAQVLATVTILLMLTLLVSRGYVDRVFGSAAADLAHLRGQVDSSAYLERFGGYATNRGYSARANAELGDYVRARTSPDERIFLIGISGAGVYFLSDRLTAHRFLRVNFFVDTDFPDPEFRLEPVLAGLAVSRPRYIIFERLHGLSTMAKTADALPGDPRVLDLLKQLPSRNAHRRLHALSPFRLNHPVWGAWLCRETLPQVH